MPGQSNMADTFSQLDAFLCVAQLPFPALRAISDAEETRATKILFFVETFPGYGRVLENPNQSGFHSGVVTMFIVYLGHSFFSAAAVT